MESKVEQTSFTTIYDSFLSRVTSDMYMEMTEIDTIRQLQGLLLNAIPRFKLPRFDIFDYEEGYWAYVGQYCGVESNNEPVDAEAWIGGYFNSALTAEEINILSMAMVVEWLGQQITTTDLSRMKYTGSDFKMSSQANHIAKLKVLKDNAVADCKSLQDAYKRRKRVNGSIQSTLGSIMSTPSYGYKIP